MQLAATLPDLTRSAIEKVMAYRNDRVLERFTRDYGNAEVEADRVFESFKQFMVACIVADGPKTTSPTIDDMWHTFVLHTRDYRTFCDEYLGGFIEHEPVHDGGAPENYRATRDLTFRIFGMLDEECWPVQGKSSCSSGCGSIEARLQLA
jgi:hypothetical protein